MSETNTPFSRTPDGKVRLPVIKPFRFVTEDVSGRVTEREFKPLTVTGPDGKPTSEPREYLLDPNDASDAQLLNHSWISEDFADGALERPDETCARLEASAAQAAQFRGRQEALQRETERSLAHLQSPALSVDQERLAEALVEAHAVIPGAAEMDTREQVAALVLRRLAEAERLGELLRGLEPNGLDTPLHQLRRLAVAPRVQEALDALSKLRESRGNDGLDVPLNVLRGQTALTASREAQRDAAA